ncbi:cytoplasmic dynein 2 heavy chain 1 isoform X2 [Aricia agestis]|uniref:cytoplasmic dynein 2 heavy chain 1 isoform X2 n=1 Tax=Aricia agestis TaxID=91739 RepID=UPI001C207415|nr:cytoplasmic dynein 2 heavy chain 1 isoform X2 [Aricia agestis]
MKSISSVRDFITNALGLLLQTSDLNVNDINEELLHDFLHSPQTLLLQAFLDQDSNLKFQIHLQCNLNKSIIFYKTLPCTLEENSSLNNVNMLTLSTNAALSLYQILKQIYSPLLTNGDDLYSKKLQKNLADLESNLRVIAHGKEDIHNNFVLSVEDEAEYWKSIAERTDTNKAEREAASSFSVLFDDISEEIKLMRSSTLQEVKDCVENVAGILDDVWRCVGATYSQDRMVHVFDVVGHATCSIIQKCVSDLNIWSIHHNAEDDKILAELSHGLNAIQTWTSACKSLTETYWPNYALHPWKGNSYVPLFCVNFEGRLKQINDIRSTFNQLNKLMTNTEKMEFGIDNILSTFQNVNMWIINGPNHQWESALSKLSANLRQAEMNVAEKLKPRFQNTSVHQMLYEFQRYRTLMSRAVIKSALSSELERLVAGLAARLASMHAELDAGERACPPDLTPVVRRVQWAKRAEAKVNEIKTCTEKYLSEFDKSSEVISLSTTLLKDLKSTYTQCLEDWSRELQVQVKSGSLSLSQERPVLEFRSGLLTVTLSERAATWVGEAHALASYAPLPPAAARELAALADKLPHARALDQIASFHNTLGERMIPSTRPMMLQAALDLSALVQDQKPVYWNDEQQLTEYIDRLKTAVLKLETENTYLTSQHIAIRNIVEQLMDTELLAQQTQWKKQIKDIRNIIEKVVSNGYKNTEMWRSHWDMQLYKAIECQYIKAMLSLETHFPPVKVDLVLRGNTVCLQPRAEELRATLYAQLRRLVALPSHMPPLAAANDMLFTGIVQKHSWIGNKAVCALEAALAATERVRARWARRSAACVVDLGALCAEHLITHSQFEHNFKACKSFGQAVAKMTFEDEKVYWITISPWALRRELESAAHRLWGALVSALRANCRAHADTLAAFVATAATLAARAPATPRDLAELSAERHAVRSKIPEMEELVEDLKKKGHMLRTWGGDSTVDDAIKEWQRVRDQLDSQQELFEHQAETVKAGLLSEWDSVQARTEAWAGRWSGRVSDVRADTLAELTARAADLSAATQLLHELRTERDQLITECKKFDIELDISSTWDDAEEIVKEFNRVWSVLLDYNQEYEALSGTEWVVFARKLHALDEFAASWAARLEPYTPVTLLLKREIDRYTDLTPALKYLRGTDFTEKHWREIFNVLEMEPKNPDSLTLKDLLDVAPNIRRHVKDIQKISGSASSEAAISSTLNEIELWYAGARFTLVRYTDSAKRTVPIVKDYKDIITKVSELQWAGSAGGGGGAARGWLDRLHAAGTLARAAHHAQRRWLYLEPILATDEGDLGAKFRKVDQAFKQVARIFEADPRLSVLMQSTRLQPMLDSISEQLNSCQSALNQYMDDKRTIFPRLYFLSDDDLLELLGEARAGAEGREAVMQTHLKKLFPGITGVKLGPGGLSITALCSHFGETFQLDQSVDIDCSVEVWLKNFENEIRSSLKNLTLKCLKTSSVLEQDPFSLPTQIICLTQNIRFTQQVEKAINSKELHELKSNLEKESVYYAEAEVEDEGEKYRRQALILQCDFHILAVQSLIEGNVVATSDWLWQKQLRFYFQDNDVVAKMALATIPYSYEYLGVQTGQFVRTSETDECFLILTQSLHLGLVGNPFGPAGTGKTESVKALGGLFGRLVLVFNCDEAMDSACVGRVLRGIALSGAWGCLDEFNRLSAAALAAAAHQLAALRAQRPTIDGKEVSVSPWCGVMVTMNPTGRGYGGRRALPSALSALLRPLALRPPDARELATRLLVARRVSAQDARALAAALHDVFTFASSLLSGARHYDWGLRALKAAVGACGAALERRGGGALDGSGGGALATLRDVLRLTSSKLNAYDAQRFESILSMVFAGVLEEEETNSSIRSALESAVKQLKLVHNEFQIQKCKELYEQMQQRMGVAIVGPPGSGKSTIRKILKTALSLLGHTVSERSVMPKAMSRAWLLGRADRDTCAWTDGVVAVLAHHAAALPADISGWMVFDGDVEAGWAEALNSLLDDNRLLALAGSRVQLPAHAHAIFETHHLDDASPATVSRLAIILLNEDNNCAQQVLESFMRAADYDDELAKMALPQLQTAIAKCLQWFNTNRYDLNFKPDHIPVVHQIIAQFEYLVHNTKSSNTYTSVEDIVYLSVERAVAGIVKDNAVDKFYEQVLGGVRIHNMELETEELDSSRLVWSPRIRRAAATLRALLRTTHNVLLTGPDANGKSLLLEQALRDYNGAVVTIECTPLLEPADILMELKRSNVLRSGEAGEGGAVAGGGDATLLVRGLHRARADRCGSRPVHAFLMQLCAGGAWEVGGDGPEWLRAHVRVLATARSQADISPRLRAILTHIIVDETEEEELLELTKMRLKENGTKELSDEEVLQLARNIVLLYKEITETFISQPHYSWDTSHLDTICENVKWYSPSTLQDVHMALNAEANMIFRERLITDDEKIQYKSIAEKYLKCGSEVYFMPKLRSDGVYLEAMDYDEWCRNAGKLINQCLTDNENVFGDSAVEVSTELASLFPAITTAMRGGVAVFVSASGGGVSAAATLVCAALAATCHVPPAAPAPLAARLTNTFKTALTSASDGMRICILLHAEGSQKVDDNDDDDDDSAAACLSHVEALVRARTASALPAALARAAPNTTETTLYDIKQNVGIVICIDKNEESLWQLFSRFPWLSRAPQWAGRWSDATLRRMPALIIQRLIKESGQEITKDDIDSIPVEGFVNVFSSLQSPSMQAPCRYVNLIRSYFHILTQKKEALIQRKNVLSAGVEALKRARIEVATLQKEAVTQEAALSEEQTKANAALEQISATVRANSDKKEEMNELKKNIERENEQLQIRKKEIEDQLAAVEPVIAAARAAVGDIRQDALSEVRSLRAPPDAVRDVLEGVLRLMGIADTSWHSMKNFLAKRGVKEDIRRLDAADISSEAVAAVSRLVERRAASFEDATARRASAACAPLAAWVRAQLAHAAALRHVRPLRDKQQELESAVRSAEAQLAALVSGVASVEERVAALTRALGEHTRAAATLELRLADAAAALARAAALLDHLAHEYNAWETQLEDITKELSELNLLSLLAAAYVVYLPELTEQQARDVIKNWATLMGHEDLDFSPSNFLSAPDKQFKWISDGLPSDQTALKSAIVIDQYLSEARCGFSPLIIDPDGEAEAWLRTALHAAPVDFVPQHSDKLKTAVQYAIRHSRVLVITEAEGCGWWCGAARTLQLSRAPPRAAPRPRCAARTSVLHFAPRLHALVDQLSHFTIQKQNPSMMERYKEVKLQKVALQKQQYELQENLLRELSQARDILHDDALSRTLQQTRATAEHIAAALAASDQIEAEVSRASAAYAPLAARAAALALAVKRLQPRRPTLHLPFDCVQALFLDTVQRYQDMENSDVDEAVRYFMRMMFDRIQLSLHRKDKYVVLMYLLKQVYGDMMPDKLWKIFINHISVEDDAKIVEEIRRQHDWIGDEYLSKLAQIKMQDEDLYNRMSLDNSQLWRGYQSSGDETTIRRLNLNPFEQVLAVAALRPQSTYRAVVAFVDKILGRNR